MVDLTKVLSNPDSDIRRKTLDLIQTLLNSRNVNGFLPVLKKELKAVIQGSSNDDSYMVHGSAGTLPGALGRRVNRI